MNLRKIKLALTVGLMNKTGGTSIISAITELMTSFKTEVGSYIDQTITKHLSLNQSLEQQTVAIRFENLVLDVDFVTNTSTRSQYIQGFHLR